VLSRLWPCKQKLGRNNDHQTRRMAKGYVQWHHHCRMTIAHSMSCTRIRVAHIKGSNCSSQTIAMMGLHPNWVIAILWISQQGAFYGVHCNSNRIQSCCPSSKGRIRTGLDLAMAENMVTVRRSGFQPFDSLDISQLCQS
jgi:hypothetical protein